MECVSSPRYSLMINGSLVRYFEGRRGLRQGDLVSSSFSVICVEYLTNKTLKLMGDKP